MLRKPELYKKAILLRYKGFSYGEILKHIVVSQSTISRWCCQIPLTEKQKKRLIKKKRNSPLIRQLREQATQSKKQAKIWAKDQISKILNGDDKQLLFISGILLYWAEGTKSGGGGGIEFTNTDPDMIKIMDRFFRQIMRVPKEKFRVIVRIDGKGDVMRAEKYWSKTIKIPRKNFRKPEMLNLNKNSKSINKYPYGMCRIAIYDILLKRKMLSIIKEFSKKFSKRAI